MLDTGKMIGFLFTNDYDKARAFYVDKLGCEFVSLDQFALAVSLGGHMIRISKIPKFEPAQGTVLGWAVDDIYSVADWLRGRGVTFEIYPFVEDKQSGIWNAPGGARVAWFKDPDGNVLSLSQHPD